MNDSTTVIILPPERGRATDTTAEFQSIPSRDVTFARSPFTHRASHEIRIRKSMPYQPDWIAGLLLFVFILLAWTRFFHGKRLSILLKAPFTKRHQNQLIREGNLFRERMAISLETIYLIVFPLLVYEMMIFTGMAASLPFSGINLYLVITLGTILYWIFKAALIRFLGNVFQTLPITYEYLLNMLLINILTGIVVLPFLIFAVYLKSGAFLYIAATFVMLLLLFQFIRGFMIGMTVKKFSYFYLFVYLCTLEILPLLVIAKLVINFD
jgi:hypothetical protein